MLWRPTREGGGVQTRVSVCTQARGRLPVRLVSERLDETGAAVRLARLRGPSLLCLELEGLVSSMVPGGPRWGEGDALEVPVILLPPGLWSPPGDKGLVLPSVLHLDSALREFENSIFETAFLQS